MIAALVISVLLAASPDDAHAPLAEVSIVRAGEAFEAEYRFHQEAQAWVFYRSGRQRGSGAHWRSAVWEITTPGVVLAEDGHFSYLAAADGGPVPRTVSVRFAPQPLGLAADYDPALIFSDGSVALFSDQFDVFPRASAEAAAGLPADLNMADDIPVRPTRTCWRDPGGPVLYRGEWQDNPCGSNAQTYAFFGREGVTETAALATILDTGLPDWIAAEIASFSPQAAAWYTGTLGEGLESRPMIMASWNGPSSGVTSMGGSVLPGLIVMAFEGEGLLTAQPRLTGQMRWFIAHEIAHFWLGQTVRYAFQHDMWITEGGADLAALRALEALDPEWQGSAAFLQQSLDDCAARAASPIESAAQRGDFRVYYACGTIFAHVLEHTTGRSWPELLAGMIASNRDTGVLTRENWLASLDGQPHGELIASILSGLLEDGADDSVAALARLLEAAGVPHARNDEGQIRLVP